MRNKTGGTTGSNQYGPRGTAKRRPTPSGTQAANLMEQADDSARRMRLKYLQTTCPPLAQLSSAFSRAGHRLWLVGGPVRDMLGDRAPKDFDCCTDADPQATKAILDPLGPVYTVGEAYGTIGVAIQGEVFEVTTLRGEQYEPDSRHPQVTYLTEIDQDLRRRDFTVNAMAIDLESGDLIDPFGGHADLRSRRLRTPPRHGSAPADIDQAVETLTEDPLRVARAIRFHACRGFDIDPDLSDAMAWVAPQMSSLAVERLNAETERIITESHPSSFGRALEATPSEAAVHMWGVALDQKLLAVAPDLINPVARRAAIVQAADRQGVIQGFCARRKWRTDDFREAVATWQTSEHMSSDDMVAARIAVRRAPHTVLEAALHLRQESGSRISGAWLDALDRVDSLKAEMPIKGNDPAIIAAGLKGPQIGAALARMERLWVMNPDATRDDLVPHLPQP